MKAYSSLAIILAIALMISSCLPLHGEDIPFDTVIPMGNGYDRGYVEPKSKIVVATSPEEVDELKTLLSPNDWGAFQNTNLSTDFVVAAFQGAYPFGEGIEIISVRQRGYQVSVIANLVILSPGTPTTLEKISAYHVIKVKQADLAHKGRIIFVLMNTSGRAVANTVHELQ